MSDLQMQRQDRRGSAHCDWLTYLRVQKLDHDGRISHLSLRFLLNENRPGESEVLSAGQECCKDAVNHLRTKQGYKETLLGCISSTYHVQMLLGPQKLQSHRRLIFEGLVIQGRIWQD